MKARSGVAVYLVVALLATACRGSSTESEGSADEAGVPPDPAPEVQSAESVNPSGETVITAGELTVRVPATSFSEDATVQIGEPIGEWGPEVFGQPLGIEHDGEVEAPVTAEWDISSLSDEQRASLVLARWDEDLGVWIPGEPDQVTWEIDGDTLIATITEFSFWDWIANAGQTVGEVIGSRIDAPSCDGSLPDWVTNTVRPDADINAAAIRTCFERDGGDRVTVRVANNRTFTQMLEMTDGREQWAWTWANDSNFGPSGAVYNAARFVFDSETRHLMPPLHETAVGIARPEGGGSHFVSATTTVSPVTVFVDFAVYAIGELSPGGLSNPLLNVFAQALFECGGEELLEERPGDTDAVARFALSSVKSCVETIMDNTTDLGSAFHSQVREAIRDSANPEQVTKGHRWLRQLAGAVRILTLGVARVGDHPPVVGGLAF